MSKLPLPPRARALYEKGGEANSSEHPARKLPPRPSRSEGGAKERNTELVGVWLPPSLLKRLDAYRGGKTRPQAIRELLGKYL